MTKLCVFDLETSISKGPHSGTFRDPSNDFYTIIIGTNPDQIQVQHLSGGFNRQIIFNDISMKIKNSDCIVGHNLPFDLSYIWKIPIIKEFLKKGGQVWDTQIAEYLMTGQRHAFASLAELQLKYLDEKIKEDRISKLFSKKHGANEFIQKQNKYPRIFKLFDKYCHDDGSTTLRIAIKQIQKAKEMGMIDIIKVYNAYMLGLVETMTNGIQIDMLRTEKTLKAFRLKSLEYLQQSEIIIKEYWNHPLLPSFNVMSPTHKSALLFGGVIKCKVREDQGFYKNGNPKSKIIEHEINIEGFKLPTQLTSPSEVKGRFKTGADIIDKISEFTTNPIIKQYCKLQQYSMNMEKMCSTYLEPFLNLSINGILYPQYNNCATTTGRLSSSKPNLQNIPSKGGIEKYIKSLFIAPEEYICVSIDYSMLEIYIQALVTNDTNLIKDLLNGIDFHILRLSYAEDKPYDEVYKLCKIDKVDGWDLKRAKAKTISYQKAYGASPKKLALSTGINEEVIKKIFQKEDETYPGVKYFNDMITEEIQQNAQLSKSIDIPKFRKGNTKYSKRFIGGIEQLPVMKTNLNADYYDEEFRHIGYHKSLTGKQYAFEEVANYDRNGNIRKGFSPTQIKNYPQQGGAADIVAMATAEVFKYILSLQNNEVKMINQVHDSLEFYIKKDTENLHIPAIKSIMEDVPALFYKYLAIKAPFKFKVEIKTGKDFYNLEEYKKC